MCGATVTGAAQENREYYGSALSGVRRVCPRLTFTDPGYGRLTAGFWQYKDA